MKGKGTLKSNVFSGLIVIAPLAVTAYVVYWVYGVVVGLPGSELLRFTDRPVLNEVIQFTFTVFLIAAILFSIGYVTRTATGVFFKRWLDKTARRVPIVGFFYNATQMAVEAISMGSEEFRRPVKMDFGGVRFTGFKTGGKTDGGREVVFVPTAPNITSGVVVEVDPDLTEDAEESTEEALTRILSAGFASAGDEEVAQQLEVLEGFDLESEKEGLETVEKMDGAGDDEEERGR